MPRVKNMDLTKREIEVLSMLNLTNREIGEKMSLGESMVELYVSRLLKKMGGATRTDLILIGIANGIVPNPYEKVQQSKSIHPLIGKLIGYARRCSVDNWGGYRESALKVNAILQARLFLEWEIKKGMTDFRQYQMNPTAAGNMYVGWRENDIDCGITFDGETIAIDLENLRKGATDAKAS